MRRLYESTFIVNAALEDSDVEAVIAKVTSYIENQGGEIKSVDKWGRRRLAYPINKKFNGFYVHIEFETAPNVVPIVERFFVLEDTVLRHLTLLLPEELKALREKKALERGKPSALPFDDDDDDKKDDDKKDDEKKDDEKKKDAKKDDEKKDDVKKEDVKKDDVTKKTTDKEEVATADETTTPEN